MKRLKKGARKKMSERAKEYYKNYGRIAKKLYIDEDVWIDIKREFRKVKREVDSDKPLLVRIGEWIEKKAEEDGIVVRTEGDSEFLEKLEEHLSGGD